MKPTLKQYLKLKREAMRQMLTGDMERYLHSLRLLSEIRAVQRSALA